MGIKGSWSVRNYLSTLGTLLLPPLLTPNSFLLSAPSFFLMSLHPGHFLFLSRVGFGLWSVGLNLHQACLPGCPLETRSKLPFLLGFLPQRISLKTFISLRVRSCCRPSPTPGSKTSLASPSSPRVLLTPPTSRLSQGMQPAKPQAGHPDSQVTGPDGSHVAALGPLRSVLQEEIYFPEVSGQEKTHFLEACQEGGNPPRKQTRPFSL